MEQYIKKSALVAEIRKRLLPVIRDKHYDEWEEGQDSERIAILDIIDTLEVKEIAPIAYVVTRCEEHSDYVEEVFLDEDKAQEYCEQFKGNENEYARHITKVKVTL